MTMLFYEDDKELAGLGYPGPERRRYLNVLPSASVATSAAPAVEAAS
jgi:hypothetical protein